MVIGATRTTLSTVGVRPEVLWWHKPGCGVADGGSAIHYGGSQHDPRVPCSNCWCARWKPYAENENHCSDWQCLCRTVPIEVIDG